MAAIDKLYVHTFQEYEEVKLWALVYYPKLLLWFYNVDYREDDYEKSKKEWIINTKKFIERDWERVGNYKTKSEAIHKIIKHYKETADYDCPFSQAKDEFEYLVKQKLKSTEELENEYSFPIMSTPFRVDRKLKWICPVPCVREYLHKQCGVNPKWEWLYKIFWKGKKYF